MKKEKKARPKKPKTPKKKRLSSEEVTKRLVAAGGTAVYGSSAGGRGDYGRGGAAWG